MTLTTLYRTVARRARLGAVAVVALASACQSKAPDAGGDTALARDLAQAQLRSMQPSTERGEYPALHAGDTSRREDTSGTVVVATSPDPGPPVVVPAPKPQGAQAPASTHQPVGPRVDHRPGDTTSAGACGSPALAQQRACIAAHLAVSDARLNRVYGELISVLRERAHVSAGPDPRMVRGLRSAQRAWIVARDRECQRRTRGVGGKLWAPPRAACLAEVSSRRADELAGMLREAKRR